MTYTPPPRPTRGNYVVTLSHPTGTYEFPERASSAAMAILKARAELARALGLTDTYDTCITTCGVIATTGETR